MGVVIGPNVVDLLLLGPGSSIVMGCIWSSGWLLLIRRSDFAPIVSCLTTCKAFGILCWAGGSSWRVLEWAVSAGVLLLLLLLWFSCLLLLAPLRLSSANGMDRLGAPKPHGFHLTIDCEVVSLIGRASSFFTNFRSLRAWTSRYWTFLSFSSSEGKLHPSANVFRC